MFFPGSTEDRPDRPLPPLRLAYAGQAGVAQPHLSVDGMTPHGPNLSHWPGNRTPSQWRADLSTGIALRFARAPEADRAAFLGEARHVVNDHYDTDGFGSLLAVLEPEVAFRHEELLLAAAAVGDFGCWVTWRGFAIDRIVKNLATAASPVGGAFRGVEGDDALSQLAPPVRNVKLRPWDTSCADFVSCFPRFSRKFCGRSRRIAVDSAVRDRGVAAVGVAVPGTRRAAAPAPAPRLGSVYTNAPSCAGCAPSPRGGRAPRRPSAAAPRTAGPAAPPAGRRRGPSGSTPSRSRGWAGRTRRP